MSKQRRRTRVLQNGRDAPKARRGVYLPHDMLTHKNFRKLNGSSVKVLLELCAWHSGFNNRKISCSYGQLAKPLGLGRATVKAALDELQKYEFIVCINKGYFIGRKASIWEITFLRSEGYEPTDLWKDPEQRPRRPHLEPVKMDLIQEVMNAPEIKKQNTGSNSECEEG